MPMTPSPPEEERPRPWIEGDDGVTRGVRRGLAGVLGRMRVGQHLMEGALGVVVAVENRLNRCGVRRGH